MPPARKRIRKRPAPDLAPGSPKVEEQLLEAIESLLASGQTFGSLTVAQLAREAGIGRATFYLHFRDKGELVRRLMRQLTAEVVHSAGAWFTEGGAVDRRSMQAALHGIVATFKKHQAVLAAVSDMAPFDPAVAEAHEQMMDELCALSRKAVARVRKDGRASRMATPELATTLTWFLELYCARFIAGRNARQLHALVDVFAHVCGNAIFTSPQAPSPQT